MNGILLFFRSKMDQGPFCFMKVKATQFQISLPLLPLIQCTYKEESFVKKLSSIQVILDIRSFEANSISIPTYEKANLLEWKPIFLYNHSCTFEVAFSATTNVSCFSAGLIFIVSSKAGFGI